MFHQVKIIDPKGKVKKILSPKKLSKSYWGEFFDPDNKSRQKSPRRKKTKPIKNNKVDMSYDDVYFSED